MRKIFSYLLFISCILMTSCSEDNTPVQPTLALAVGEVFPTTATVNVTTTNTSEAAYLCLPAEDAPPTNYDVWQKGKAFNPTQMPKISLSDLKVNKTYRIYVVVRNSVYADMQNVEFTTKTQYNIESNMTYANVTYYGDAMTDGNGYYMLYLGTDIVTDKGLPTKVNQDVMHLYLASKPSIDGDAISLASGTYTLTEGKGIYTVYSPSSLFQHSTGTTADGKLEGYGVRFISTIVKVEKDNEGIYTIEVSAQSEYDPAQYIHATYKGKLTYTVQDPSHYNALRQNLEVKPTKMTGRFIPYNSNFSIYYLTLFNVPSDANGFINGAGDLLNLLLIANPNTTMDLNNLKREFTIISGESSVTDYKPGKSVGGIYSSNYGIWLPNGSYYAHYDETGENIDIIGLLNSGTITISADSANPTNLHIVVNATTKKGYKITLDYTCPDNTIIDSTSASSSTSAKVFYFHGDQIKPIFGELPAFQLFTK